MFQPPVTGTADMLIGASATQSVYCRVALQRCWLGAAWEAISTRLRGEHLEQAVGYRRRAS